jgi:hypothetical protein
VYSLVMEMDGGGRNSKLQRGEDDGAQGFGRRRHYAQGEGAGETKGWRLVEVRGGTEIQIAFYRAEGRSWGSTDGGGARWCSVTGHQ